MRLGRAGAPVSWWILVGLSMAFLLSGRLLGVGLPQQADGRRADRVLSEVFRYEGPDSSSFQRVETFGTQGAAHKENRNVAKQGLEVLADLDSGHVAQVVVQDR